MLDAMVSADTLANYPISLPQLLCGTDVLGYEKRLFIWRLLDIHPGAARRCLTRKEKLPLRHIRRRGYSSLASDFHKHQVRWGRPESW